MLQHLLEIFKSQSAERIYPILQSELLDTQEGLAQMRLLKASRPAVFNRVLCELYDVACYKNGDSCFSDQVPAEDLDKWFISTLAESDFASQGEAEVLGKLYASLDEAEAAAVEAFGLDKLFFNEPVSA